MISIVCCSIGLPCRDVSIEQCSCEELVARFGLVVWHFVTRPVDSTERQVAVLTHLATAQSVVHDDILIPGGMEVLCTSPVDCERDSLSTDPVARVISIAVDQGDLDPLAKEVSQILQPGRPRVVAYTPESPRHGRAALGPVQRHPERPLDPRLMQVP